MEIEEARSSSKFDLQECGICLPAKTSVRNDRGITHLTGERSRIAETFIENVNGFLGHRDQDARYASFDYCFNYFQQARSSSTLGSLLDSEHAELTCLQLGFYLASWGMYRGSAPLLQRSSHALMPVVEVLISAEQFLWEIDAPDLLEHAGDVMDLLKSIQSALDFGSFRVATETLTTKILLGTMGTVPAFDQYFKKGFSVSNLSKRSIQRVGRFYEDARDAVDSFVIPTLDFHTGSPSSILYTKSKIIDMGFFTSGLSEKIS